MGSIQFALPGGLLPRQRYARVALRTLASVILTAFASRSIQSAPCTGVAAPHRSAFLLPDGIINTLRVLLRGRVILVVGYWQAEEICTLGSARCMTLENVHGFLTAQSGFAEAAFAFGAVRRDEAMRRHALDVLRAVRETANEYPGVHEHAVRADNEIRRCTAMRCARWHWPPIYRLLE